MTGPRTILDDDRGVSAVVGFVLMFGLLILLLGLVQATAVPVWNQNVEYDHSLQVEDSLAEFRDDVLTAAGRGGEYSSSVALGVVYPDRLFLLNPANPTGTIRTVDPGPVTVQGATATGETGDRWNGSTVTYSTQSVVYDANYNEYANAPRYVVDNTAFAADFGDFERNVGAPTLVSDRRISLVLVNGTLRRTGVGTESLVAHSISAPAQTVPVRSDTGPITLTVPTVLGESYWQTALADETVANGGHVLAIDFQSGEPYNELTIRLETGVTYELSVAKVGVGTDRESDSPHYIVDRSGPRNLRVGTTDRYTFQVRDRYDNPVSGVDVSATVVDGPGTVTAVDGVSDDEGVTTFEYTADASGTAVIRATFDDGSSALETATVTVDVAGSGGGGGGGGESVGTGGTVQWSPSDTTETVSQQGGLWQGVDGASSLGLSNARFTPVRPSDQQFDPDDEYLRFVLVFRAGDTEYVYEFTDSKDGVVRTAGGAWSNTKVNVWRRTGDVNYEFVGSADLSPAGLERLYDGTATLDLLSTRSYDGSASAVVQLRNWLRSNQDVEVYVADMDGRVTITLE